MGTFNYLVSLRFGIVVCNMFPMLLLQSTEGGGQRGGLGQKELVTLPKTYLVTLETGVETSMPFLLTL